MILQNPYRIRYDLKTLMNAKTRGSFEKFPGY
jgi:hypothetical protein